MYTTHAPQELQGTTSDGGVKRKMGEISQLFEEGVGQASAA